MADVFSWTERLRRITDAEDALATLKESLQDARDFERSARKRTFVTGTLETRLEAMLAGISSGVTNGPVAMLQELTSNNPGVWQMVVRPSYVEDWTSTDIDADDGSSQGVLTANSGTPFTGFEVGDVVLLSNAEDSTNNVERTIAAITSTVMTFSAILPGADNSDDETLTLTLKER